MTQLPEVEVIRKDLEKEVVGKRFKDVTVKSAALVARHRNRPEFYKALQGRKIDSVARRGTWLLFRLDDGSTLVVQLGSQGTLTRETATEEAGRHTLFVATFTTGGALHYTDPAKEGELFVLDESDLGSLDAELPAGVDPLADQLTWHVLGRSMQERQAPLKALLVDESFIIGLGDIYSDEVLWAAGLGGERSSASLSSQEVRRLYRGILEVLYEGVKQRGAAEIDMEELDPFGEISEYGEHVKVYGRAGKPCARCRKPIVFGRIARKYESYYCANCQT